MGDVRAYGGVKQMRENETMPVVSREEVYVNQECIHSSVILLSLARPAFLVLRLGNWEAVVVLRKQVGTSFD
jgi:hypothetical protein